MSILALPTTPMEGFQTKHPSTHAYLGRNYALSDVERNLVIGSLLDSETELSKLNAEITRISQYLDQLGQNRAELDRHVKGLKALISPAKRLPVELWEDIFLLCLPQEPQVRPSAPLVLSHVCRGWRNLVLSSPRLWSSLAIQTTARHERRGDEQKSKLMIEFWLQRSAACPVSMSLVAGAQFQACRTPSSRLTPIWDALLPHSSHLRSLDLQVPESSITPLLTSTVCDFPILETLNIDVCPETQAQQPSFCLDRAPRLKNVAFLHVTFDIRPLKINYAQLTELTILPQSWAKPETFLTLDECLDILAQGVQLQSFTLSVEDVMPRQTGSIQSQIRDLNIMFRDSDRRADMRGGQPVRIVRLGQFFDLLEMPALRNLTVGNFVGNFGGSDTWPHRSFLSHLARSTPPLDSLQLIYVPMFETEVIECLRLVPHLSSLVIEVRQRTGAQRSAGDLLLSGLTGSKAVACVVPRLRSLDFRYCGKRCTESSIIEFVESRRRGFAIVLFKSFKIHMSHPPSVVLSQRVDRWSEQGIEVEINHEEYSL